MCAAKENCNCGCNLNGRIVVKDEKPPELDPFSLPFKIVGKRPIKVKEYMESGVRVFEISYSPVINPTAKIAVEPTTAEVGIPFNAKYTLSYTKGSEDIVEKSLVPEEEYVDTNPTSFTKTGLKSMVAGDQFRYTYKVKDELGNEAEDSVAVKVLYRHYTKTVAKNSTLLAADIKTGRSGLGMSISEALGANSLYTMGNAEGYFTFWTPSTAPNMPTPRGAADFPFELVDMGEVEIDGIMYKGKRTKTAFAANGQTYLKF